MYEVTLFDSVEGGGRFKVFLESADSTWVMPYSEILCGVYTNLFDIAGYDFQWQLSQCMLSAFLSAYDDDDNDDDDANLLIQRSLSLPNKCRSVLFSDRPTRQVDYRIPRWMVRPRYATATGGYRRW
jgi:hypothetical protein